MSFNTNNIINKIIKGQFFHFLIKSVFGLPLETLNFVVADQLNTSTHIN